MIAVLIDNPNQKFWYINTHLSHDFTFYQQKCQIRELVRNIDKLDGPKIIAGDFNCYSKTNNICFLSLVWRKLKQ